jgi:hypothetical protein
VNRVSVNRGGPELDLYYNIVILCVCVCV